MDKKEPFRFKKNRCQVTGGHSTIGGARVKRRQRRILREELKKIPRTDEKARGKNGERPMCEEKPRLRVLVVFNN